jgi:hypothetical protein
MPVAVRRPAGLDAVRDPDVAVGRVDAPGAVRVEVLVADDVLRDVARGRRSVVGAVALADQRSNSSRRGAIDALVIAKAGPVKR